MPLTTSGAPVPAASVIVFTFSVVIYTTVQADPEGTVTVTPSSIVIGPALTAFFPDVIV
jgi:hypothetical protein